MSNEELVVLIQGGDRTRTLEFRRLVARQAYRWRGVGRLETDDFMQAGFLALLRAVDIYDEAAGAAFSTWLFQHIRAEFTEATGQGNEQQRAGPAP